MLFKATEAQVRKIGKNALEAMGIKIPAKSITMDRLGPKAGLFIDSMLGKSVKLLIKRMAKPIWYLPDKEPPKKAGWTKKYKTYKDLVKSVKGVEIFGPVDSKKPLGLDDTEKATQKPKLKKTALNKKVESQVKKPEGKGPDKPPAEPKKPDTKATTKK